MNNQIKNGVIFGITTFITLLLCGLAYAAVSNSVNSGDTLTASMWNNMHNYSTDEVNTGKKWINGKDIYRKVVYPSSDMVAGVGWQTISWTDAPNNIDKMIFGNPVSNSYDGMSFWEGTTGVRYKVNWNGLYYIIVGSTTKPFNTSSPFVLEYTKTN